MNFYKHHIGDYAAATSHLSFVEDAAYSRLLRIYYRDEKPLPADVKAVQRLAGAREPDERAAVETVLGEFFTLQTDGWHSKRCDEEISKASVQADTNRRIAEQREAKRRERIVHEPLDESSNETSNDSCNEPPDDSLPLREPSQTPDSRLQTEDQEKTKPDGLVVAGKPATAACPHAEIVAIYHETLPSLIRVRDWTPARQSLLRKRWLEKPERQTLGWWREFFEYVAKSDFLMGRKSGRDGPFDCDLEWLVSPKNFVKVVEGKYHRGAA